MANTVKVQGSKTVARARKGQDGKGILSVIDYFQVSSSSTTAPTSWVATTPPAFTDTAIYLWTYSRTNYSDGSYTQTTPHVVGVAGKNGLSYRYSTWSDQSVEYRNDNNPYYRDSDGKGIIDVVYRDQISIWDPSSGYDPPGAWVCRKTHTSGPTTQAGSNIYALPTSGDNAAWASVNSQKPILTALVLAAAIKADFIDVKDLSANSAFIQNLLVQSAFIDELIVKRLETVDNNGKGVKIEGNELTAYDSSGNACVNITGDSIGNVGGSSSSTNISAQTLSGTQNNIGPQTTAGGMQEMYHRQTSNLSGSAKSLGTLASGAVVAIPSHTLTFKLKSNTSNVNSQIADGYFTVSIYKGSTLIASAPQMGVSLRGYGANTERSETIIMPACSFSASGSTSITYKVTFVSEMDATQTLTYTVSVPTITVTASVANKQTIMGSDGFRVQLTPNAYFEAKIASNTARVTMISGSYGLRITPSGIQKTTDGGTNWSAAEI